VGVQESSAELAYCGLVCSNCGAMRHGNCQGCHSPKPMHSRCLVKKCAMAKDISCCAECKEFPELRDCRKLNNFVSKIFGVIFRSNRIGNLETIRDVGTTVFLANCSKKRKET
jgi:hypothetical protein